MSEPKLLIDTNVFIGLEDPKRVDPAWAELVRKCGEHRIHIFVHAAAYQDILQDSDVQRREISLTKIAKFEQLPAQKLPQPQVIEALFGPIRKRNDLVDVTLLHTLSINVVDFLVTEDQGIHDRVKLTPLARRVFTVADALTWLRASFEPTSVSLPFVDERYAHEIDAEDNIFDSLRVGYADFDGWWGKCLSQHRKCWVVTIQDELAGIIVRKPETPAEAAVCTPGEKILKLCTFKVKPEFRGERLGELLLKQAIWYAQRNAFDVLYLTTKSDQDFLIQLIEYFGFYHTKTESDGEMFFEKPLSQDRLDPPDGADLSELARLHYPRFVMGPPAVVFCVPIQGRYHLKLFPELAAVEPLPLFPAEHLLLPRGRDRIPGNTIRKVYLCRAKTNAMSAGDVLLFYESKSPGLKTSQAITSVGVIQSVSSTSDHDELIRLTAKRSAYSEHELRDLLSATNEPLKVIDFLLAGHIEPAIPLALLLAEGVFNERPPQSICQLSPGRVEPVKRRMSLGFAV